MIRTLRRFLGLLLVGVIIVGAVLIITSQGQQRQKGQRGRGDPDAAVPVLAATAKTADVPVYLDGVGTVRALNMVLVRSQVDGTLISVNFREGQDVKRGDVLAKIDPSTYQAMLDQQTAKKALDEAQLANARVDLERYTNLVKTNAVTKQQVDTQRALVAQLEAQVRLDQGAIDNARTYFNWTTITSPLDGRTGLRQVDQGNLVRASDATGIVTITQVRPIAVLFSLPQQQLGQVNKAFARAPLSVEAVDGGTRNVLDRGTLLVVNNQVDQLTGTVQLKAEFPNTELQLWPGQFVNIRLLIDTLQQVVVVPTAAVQRGPNGTFVYAVQPDDKVAVRPIRVSQQDETQAVIAKGVEPSDRVVTSGFSQLSDGKKVTIAAADGTPPAAPAGERPRRPRGEGGEGGGERKGGRRGQTSDASPSPAPSRTP